MPVRYNSVQLVSHSRHRGYPKHALLMTQVQERQVASHDSPKAHRFFPGFHWSKQDVATHNTNSRQTNNGRDRSHSCSLLPSCIAPAFIHLPSPAPVSLAPMLWPPPCCWHRVRLSTHTPDSNSYSVSSLLPGINSNFLTRPFIICSLHT